MKHLPKFALLISLSPFVLAACSGQTLDGGSNASGGAPASSAPAGSGTPTTPGASTDPAAIPDKPVEGQIAGKPFTPKSVDLEFSKAQNQWFLSFRNYETDCRVLKTEDKIPSKDALLINIGGVKPEAGTFTIEYADGHGATFQVGLYDANSSTKADSNPAKRGTLRFDTWSDEPGTTITGALKLSNDESDVAGTFTAKVCPAH